MALTSARRRCTLQSDSYFTLWKKKKQIMNMEWDVFVPWAGNESLGWTEFFPSCCLSPTLLSRCLIWAALMAQYELAVSCFGWYFVLGSHFATFNSKEFYSLRASVEVNSIVTARHTEYMQSSITLIFPLITNIVIIVLLDTNLESQKKLSKDTNSPLLLG